MEGEYHPLYGNNTFILIFVQTTYWMKHLIRILNMLFFAGFMGDSRSPAPSPQTSEDVSFSNGEIKLSGTLYRPTRLGRHPAIVVLHAANGGARDFHAYQHLATTLPAAG